MGRRGSYPLGFTLVEVLIVIAILSVLAAILFPVVAGASEKARQSACASNLRQIDVAFQEYADDSDGAYCSLRQPTLRYSPRSLIWPGLLYPYLNATNVYFCPSSTHALVLSSGGASFNALSDMPVNDAQLSIGMNAGLDPAAEYGCFAAQANWGPVAAKTEAACTRVLTERVFLRPAQFALFADSVPSDPHPDAPYLSSYTDPVLGNLGFLVDPALIPPDTSGGVSDRHADGTNVAFLDGHLSWFPAASLTADSHYSDLLLTAAAKITIALTSTGTRPPWTRLARHPVND